MANRKTTRPRECVQCGTSPIPGYKYCSTQCRAKATSVRLIARRGRPRPRNTVARCKRCGVTFMPKAIERRSFCSRECAFAHHSIVQPLVSAERRAYARWAKRSRAAAGVRDCDVCGKTFHPPTWHRRRCSEACDKARESERSREHNIIKTCRFRTPRHCRECGEAFQPTYGSKLRVFCSATCRRRCLGRESKAVRRARKKGVGSETIRHRQVFERDGWICQLCGKKTPERLRGSTHDDAPEMDHIIPLAAGGSHCYANVHCACRRCNIDKGDQPLGQLRLAV